MTGEGALPAEVEGELRRAAGAGQIDQVRERFLAAGDALAEGDLDEAVRLLTWTRDAAPGSAAVREALGIAYYHREEFAAAAEELETYRRLSGRQDQNHLLADCARALGGQADVASYVAAMREAGVDEERVAEGLLVLAGEQADRGELEAALATLEEADWAPGDIEPCHVRLWYMAGDIAERLGDHETAREYLEAVTAVTEGYLDAEERLAALPDEPRADGEGDTEQERGMDALLVEDLSESTSGTDPREDAVAERRGNRGRQRHPGDPP